MQPQAAGYYFVPAQRIYGFPQEDLLDEDYSAYATHVFNVPAQVPDLESAIGAAISGVA